MKVRFFNTYEPVSSLFRDLSTFLANEYGIEVEIVISRGEYRRGRELEKALAGHTGVHVTRLSSLGRQADRGMVHKAWIAALYTMQAAFYALFGPPATINVFLAQPLLIPFLGALLALVRRQPYLCFVNDILIQPPPELELPAALSWIQALLRRLIVLSWRHARAVVVIGRCMGARVQALGADPQRIHLITQWANEADIYPIESQHNRLRQDFGLDGRFVVLYAGNIGIPQYFDDLLAVAGLLRGHEEIRFVFIGGGSRRNRVEEQVRAERLDNVILLPFQHEHYTLAEIMSAGDLHFVSLRERWTGLGVPSKSYAAMAAGRPLLYQGSEQGEIARMVREEEIGAWVAQGDVAGLQAAILDFHQDAEKRVAQGRLARRLIETKYSRQRSLAQFASLILAA